MLKSTAKSVIYYLLPGVLIISLLINSNLFVQGYYTNLFLYSILGSAIVFATGIIVLSERKLEVSKFSLGILCIALLWSIYIYTNENYLNTTISRTKPIFLIISLILFIGLVFYLNKLTQWKKPILLLVNIVAAYESLLCIVQFIDSTKPPDLSNTVSGSWVNPNISAMFLTLALPNIFLKVLTSRKMEKGLYLTLTLLIGISLLVLKCRTAIIGAGLTIILAFEWQYGIFKSFFTRTSKAKLTATLAGIIILLGLSGYLLYESKKASADGRVLIWNLSAKMILEKPIGGFSYGGFEQAYNIFQAEYFKNHPKNETEIQNASHTLMAYNEYIENTIEGGLIGGGFFISFLLLILFASGHYLRGLYTTKVIEKQSPDTFLLISSALGVLALLFMSFVNFTITAVPIMCIFIFYAALITNISSAKSKVLSLPKPFQYLIGSLFLFAGSYLSYRTLIAAQDQIKIKRAVSLAEGQDYKRSLSLLQTIPINKRVPENYHQVFGNLLYEMNSKSEALAVYQASTIYYSSPELYQQIGNCFLAQKNYIGAIKNYETARYIQPNRVTPLYLLMRLYVELRDKENVKKFATEIIEMEEKIPSEKIDNYKTNAREVLKKLSKTK